MLRQLQVTSEERLSCTSLVNRIAGNGKGGEDDEALRAAVIQWHPLDALLERILRLCTVVRSVFIVVCRQEQSLWPGTLSSVFIVRTKKRTKWLDQEH